MSLLSQLTPNALTQHDMKIETNYDGMPNTFVPARNLLFYHLQVPLLTNSTPNILSLVYVKQISLATQIAEITLLNQ